MVLPAREKSAFLIEFEERQRVYRAKSAKERASWLAHPVIVPIVARGFLVSHHGSGLDGPDDPVLGPPDCFMHPSGGMEHPYHVHGPAEGARFGCYTHAFYPKAMTFEESVDQPVWIPGQPKSSGPHYGEYRSAACTLADALDVVELFCAHHRQWYITPEWRDGVAFLPRRDWQAIVAHDTGPRQSPGQLDLFTPAQDTRSPYQRLQDAIAAVLPDGDEATVVGGLDLGQDATMLDYLIDWVNDARYRSGQVPAVEIPEHLWPHPLAWTPDDSRRLQRTRPREGTRTP